ncbi:MAG: TRAP transporter large permease [Bacteroidales bacterium]
MWEIAVLICSFIILVGLSMPIAYAIGVSGILTMLVSIDSLPAFSAYALQMVSGVNKFALLAIPFFIIAGNIMNRGGIAQRLIDFAKVLVGFLPGGLAVVNIVSNMLFGAISGSAAASASAIGTMMKDEMKNAGFDNNFSTAINITSSTTGLSIPPSNVLIVYSLASGGVSVGALFLAGYIPGILTGVFLMAVAVIYAMRKGIKREQVPGFTYGVKKFFDAIPSLFLLVIVIGGILKGWFTATEASAVAVVYAWVLSMIYRTVSWRDIKPIMLESAKTSAIVLLLVSTCAGLSWIMSYAEIPQNVAESLMGVSDNKWVILILINLILLFVGIFMDITPAVLIFTPIFLPIVEKMGVDPVHFGMIMVLNLCIGLCTPPVGSLLFIGCSVSGARIEQVVKPLLPMFLVMIFALILVTLIPQLSLWLPSLFGA